MATSVMSAAHKAKMAAGRRETRAVDAYLKHLEEFGPPVQREVDRRRTESELEAADRELETAVGIPRLELLQRREGLVRALNDLSGGDVADELERAFVAVAANYSVRKGISYSTWREFGVPKTVLDEAGVVRTRRPNKRK